MVQKTKKIYPRPLQHTLIHHTNFTCGEPPRTGKPAHQHAVVPFIIDHPWRARGSQHFSQPTRATNHGRGPQDWATSNATLHIKYHIEWRAREGAVIPPSIKLHRDCRVELGWDWPYSSVAGRDSRSWDRGTRTSSLFKFKLGTARGVHAHAHAYFTHPPTTGILPVSCGFWSHLCLPYVAPDTTSSPLRVPGHSRARLGMPVMAHWPHRTVQFDGCVCVCMCTHCV